VQIVVLPVLEVVMEYIVRLSVKIISHDKQTWTFGSRELKLPFVPTFGLTLSFSDSITQPITSISYNLGENAFYCSTVHEIEYEDERLEFWVEYYKKKGWSKLDDLFSSYVEGAVEVKEGFFKNIL
jgi:hypothetical protein